MNPVFYIKKGDRLPAFTGIVKDGDGVIVNLTGCTAKFIMSKIPGGIPVVNASATIVPPPTSGQVSYAWGATDTATAGTYYAEIEVTFPGALLETFPNDGYATVIIGTDLG